MTMSSPAKGDLEQEATNGFLRKEDMASRDQDIISDSDESSEFEAKRHTWGKKLEYILSMVGYCVGMGNIWRFPYVCMRNGGGAFLIPFVLALLICGFPLYFLEVSLGQFIGKSPWHTWNICPLFRGIGLSMNILCMYMAMYHTMVLAWCLIYLVNSFKSPLPWTQCGQYWNTDDCMVAEKLRAVNDTELNNTLILENGTEVNRTYMSSTEEFWQRSVLELSSGLDDLGGIPWHTVLALIVANITIGFALIKGIKTSGKVVYVTATLPYILVGVILIMGCTLPGAADGILFYIKPDFGKLMRFQTWVEAAIQIFYSLGPCWGGLNTMASYNKFNNNCLRDSVLLVVLCEGTSIYGGFAIFSVLGHMAYVAKVPIMKFATSGAGLAFIVYPEAISYLPVPQLWGCLFFIMLFTLGLDTQFGSIETLMTTICDFWPVIMRRWRVLTTVGVMTLSTISGLLFTSRGGAYWFQLFDWYIAAFSMMLQAVLECIAVAWFYGADRFCYDIQMMIGREPPRIIVWLWKFITPIILLVLFFIMLASYPPPIFAGYIYPKYAQVIGWSIAVLPFLSIVLYACYVLSTYKGSLWQRLRDSTKPPRDWGPTNMEARKVYRYLYVDANGGGGDAECTLPLGKV